MKKSLFFAAAVSALMLTACSSENDPLQSVTQSLQTTLQDNAVGFDVYTPAATDVTRAGQAGTMTTSRLQRSETKGGGFGVYAYLVEDQDDASAATSYIDWNRNAATKNAPNFMVNEKVLWNAENLGWYYTPLKYWPNETDNDSQNTKAEMEAIGGTKHLDRLTFFAYAPYVEAGVKTEPGIMHVTDKDGKNTALTSKVIEPTIGYKASLDDPSKAVDLLWGVAPSGGLSYTAVNGETKTVLEGNPLIDMVKPDVNTSMKFLFQHALARIGINVVAAIDQVGAGGTLDSKTKITINEVTLTGMFGETGYLNLDNPTANVANWVRINSTPITDATTAIETSTTLTLSGEQIAPDLRFNGDHDAPAAQTATGVTTAKKDLINGRYFTLDETPTYSPARMYYQSDGTEKHATYTAAEADGYYELVGNNYNLKTGEISSPNYPAPLSGYYSIEEGTTSYSSGNVKATHNYTAAEAAAYNALLTGAVTTDDDDPTTATKYTAATAATYNASLTGAIASGATLSAEQATAVNTALSLTGDDAYATNGTAVISEAHATAYNATLSGAVTTDDDDPTTATKYTAASAATYNAGLTGAVTTEMVNPDNNEYGYDLPALTKLYTKSGNNYVYAGTADTPALWGAAVSATYYTIATSAIPATSIAYTYEDPVYDVERNYFMVVPTNNVNTLNGGLTDAQKEALRKVRVKIEYYITTEDDKLSAGRAQTKNVIEKDVVFPSLANGKSYMLNLVLGLTSVKMDAEVDDWKVENVNADLPQNTAE